MKMECLDENCTWNHICSKCGAGVSNMHFVETKPDGRDWFECPKCGADLLVGKKTVNP